MPVDVPADALPFDGALAELRGVFERLDADAVVRAVGHIAAARQIALYGVGREGLQLRGLAMRLFHLGLPAAVVGDMNCPPLGPGGLLITSAGPGHFATVQALLGVARGAGAATLLFTAQPGGACAALADAVVHVPAQTMADDVPGDAAAAAVTSVLPMGSLYEGALYLLFELMVLRLRARLGVAPAAMRQRHTNLE